MGSHSSFDIRKMAVLLVAIVSLASVAAFVSSDPEDGSVDASVPIEETDLGSFNDPVSDPYTFIFTKKEGSLAYIAAWSISGSGTITSSDDYSMTCTGEIGTVYVEYGAVVTTWDEFKATVGQSLYSEIKVNTGNVLQYANDPVTISNSLRIIGDNSSGSNGFIRGSCVGATGGKWSEAMITVSSDATVSISGITLDGGAEWTGTVNSYLGRGTTNSGVSSSKPVIDVIGSLSLGEKMIICNAMGYSGTEITGGGAITCSSGGSLTLDGALIRDCDSSRGGAIFVKNESSIDIKGNTQLVYNGGICLHGGAIYSYADVTINGGDISYNYATRSGGGLIVNNDLTMSGGRITYNVINAKSMDDENGNQGAGIFAASSSQVVEISGGLIANNKIVHSYTNESQVKKVGGAGLSIKNAPSVLISGGTLVDNVIEGPGSTETYFDLNFISSSSTDSRVITGGSLGVYKWNASGTPSLTNSDGQAVEPVFIETGRGKNVKISDFTIQLCEVGASSGDLYEYYTTDIYTDRLGNIYIFVPSEYASLEDNDKHIVVSNYSIPTSTPLGGKVTITGEPYVGGTLNADISKLTPPGAMIKYQWMSSADGTTWNGIEGATSSSYVIPASLFGHYVMLKVYADSYSVTGNVPSSPMEVYELYIIKYDSNGGTGVSDTKIKHTGSDDVVLTEVVPILSGNIFMGWKYGKTIYSPGATLDLGIFSESYTIKMTAQWSATQTKIYWVDDRQFKTSSDDHVVYDLPSVSGERVFLGWRTSSGTIYATGASLEGVADTSLYAVIVDKTYHATITIGG